MKLTQRNPIYTNFLNRTYTPCIVSSHEKTQLVQFKQINQDIVSFGASKNKPITDLRLIPGITCACCGTETIGNDEIESFMSEKIYYPANKAMEVIEAGRVYHKAPYMIKELEQFEQRMNKTEKEAFDILKNYSKKYPNKSFTVILNEPEIYNTNLEKLEQLQGKVLWETNNISETM